MLQSTAYVDANPDDNRVTNYQYNPQDELLYAIQPADAQGKVTYAMYTYDNLGNVTETQTYLRLGSSPQPTGDNPDTLLSQDTAAYNSLGQVYQTVTYAVGEQNGSVVAYDPVTASNWYDADGNVIMSQAGGTQEFTKCQYDGMGQVIEEYTGYDTSTDTRGTYSEAVGGANGLAPTTPSMSRPTAPTTRPAS